MSTPPENEDDRDQQKSKKPADTAFKQQRLPAWQPIITANTALPVFLIIGLIFIPIGIVLVVTSERVLEFDLDYTDTNCITSNGSNLTCADVLQQANYSGASCTCFKSFTLDKNFTGDVYFYYGLINYYQNHRRYVRSRDDNQLLGKTDRVSSDCQPFQTLPNDSSLDYTPCGAIANSKFNDTLSLTYNGNEPVPLTGLGIAWTTDKDVKFNNPPNASYFFTAYRSPPNWQYTAWQLDPSDSPDNNGYKNEDFIVWMRTAAMPTFRKLYRKLVSSGTGSFQNGLPQGNYTLNVTYNYPVTSFAGRKQFIISTSSWMGGKNPFLGWAYIAVGIICMITFVVFFILHKFWKTQNRPPILTLNMSLEIPPVISVDGTNLSCSSECSPIEESSQIILFPSTITYPSNIQQQQNSFSSNLSGIESYSIRDSSNIRMDSSKSSIDNNESSSDKIDSISNESTDKVNLSSLSFLQTKQRRINHRRNKSEPVIRPNLEDISKINSNPRTTISILESSSTSTTSNESPITNFTSQDNKRKSSKMKNISPSTNIKQITEKSSSSSSKKKKPWYNPFQSTYRQRHEEFKKVFKDLPNDERLIVDYSCAWQKEILIQGRMYISQSYLCFHANFLKWETSLCLKFKDIVSITKEKTAKVIPNAIEIRSNKNEKYFFASFATRDKSYGIIYKIWQTILIDQPLSSQQIWTMIHESYGNDLDMTTDEEDNYHQQSIHSTPDKSSTKQINQNQIYHRPTTPNSSIRSKFREKEEIVDHSSLSSNCEGQTDDDDIIPIGEEANTNTLIRQPNLNINKEENNNLITIETTSVDFVERNYLSRCSCQSHLATQLIDRTYSMSVERLFDYIFGNNEFIVDYHTSRRIKGFNAEEWKLNEETGKRERLCTYKVDVAAVFGATTICSNEKQMINCELSNSHYIIDTEVRNEGIKYADTFFVASRYCLVQIGPNKSYLKVTSEVRYIKSLMMIIKSFIEKNAMAALQDSYTDLNNRIEFSTSSVKRLDHESRQRSSNINNDKDKIISKKKHSKKQEFNSSINDSSINKHRKQINHDQIHQNIILSSSSSNHSSSSSRWSINNILIPFCLITMLILLCINIFLCLKLNEIDRMTDRLIHNSPSWLNELSFIKEENEWTILLKKQEEYYQTKLVGLHSVLISTHNALKNVTDTLNQLSKFSVGTMSKAPNDHIHSL